MEEVKSKSIGQRAERKGKGKIQEQAYGAKGTWQRTKGVMQRAKGMAQSAEEREIYKCPPLPRASADKLKLNDEF